MPNIEKFVQDTVQDLSEYLKNNNIKDVVIGISGGIDSAVSLALLAQLKDITIHAYFIDIESSSNARADAIDVCHQFNVALIEKDFKAIYHNIADAFDATDERAKCNLKARLRMMFLYHEALTHNAVVIGNSNADELFLGYFTKYADNAVDVMLLNNLTKTEVYQVGSYFKISDSILKKAPSADLYDSQTDEKEFGFKYSDLDYYYEHPDKIDKILKDKIISFHQKNLHKCKVIENKHFLSKRRGFDEK